MAENPARIVNTFATLALCCAAAVAGSAQGSRPEKPRARDLGIAARIGGTPGAFDAITDVAGVEVGQTTIISGDPPLVVGKGPVRTGVTVIHPRGRQNPDPVFGAWFTLNGNGEMTGTTWLEESGILEGPVAITNTHSVGVVRDAILKWQVSRPGLQPWGLPVVAETYDGGLNDINGFHVTDEHVFRALDGASGGRVAEGNVGGGTGMQCHQFKGGTGTSSRVLPPADGGFTVGVLVQCNYGTRSRLSVAGVPVGMEIPDLLPCTTRPTGRAGERPCDGTGRDQGAGHDRGRVGPSGQLEHLDQGSIIVVVATDAPLLPHQLKRLAVRVSLGIGRMGGLGSNSSGDIFLTFSTANPKAATAQERMTVEAITNARINGLFEATVQATEEAILNALLAAETMEGGNGLRVYALPHDRLLAAMKKYNR
jgi:L-aminopeptidase/D-esterase-like protein